MNNTTIEKLSDLTLSGDELRECMNQTNEINKIIASHPNADEALLDELLEFWGEDDDGVNSEVVVSALKNPNISVAKIISHGRDYPEAVLKNPSFSVIIKKKPGLYKNIPEILQYADCPEKLLLTAAKQKNQEYWPHILLNPQIPVSVAEVVSSTRLFDGAKNRLQDFADKVTDTVGKEFLSAYSATTRPFFVPRFLAFNRDLREHRLSDQVLCGFPFTSQKWSWPVGSNGLHMQPVAQISLEITGKLLNLPLGTGLLQIWGCVGMGLRGDHAIRIIPSTDLLDSMDSFYPPDAAWLKTDSDGAPEFEDCIVSTFNLDDYRPFKIENCRVEWVDMGKMFYPTVYKRIFLPFPQDNYTPSIDDDTGDDVTVAEELSDKIEKLKLPTGLNRYGNRLFVLGGYGDGLGNTWHTDDGDLILYHSVDYAIKITIALYCKFDMNGAPVFTVNRNADN